MENESTKRKRAAVYIRLSSEEQAKEGYSPQTQKEKVLEFIKNNDYTIDEKHIYVDLGYSVQPIRDQLFKDSWRMQGKRNSTLL